METIRAISRIEPCPSAPASAERDSDLAGSAAGAGSGVGGSDVVEGEGAVEYRAHPVEIRIDAWRRLERRANTSLERKIFAEKIAALDRERPRSASALDSADLLVAVLALAWSWVTVPAALGSLASKDVAIRRERVIHSIENLCAAALPED